jgi:phosphatidylglycerophosphatase C
VTRPVVAAFDFDGTLTHGGSVWRFLASMVGRTRVLGAGATLAHRLVYAALVGGHALDDAKERLFTKTLQGLGAADVRERSVAFGLDHYRRRGRADVRERLEWHRTKGHRIVIVSASPEAYVGAVGEELRADTVIATRLMVGEDGRLTGRYEGRNCRGQEKVDRIREWMAAEADGATPYLWAYGNSAGDLRLLAAADTGVDVGRLGRVGRLRQFSRLNDVVVRGVTDGPEDPSAG